MNSKIRQRFLSAFSALLLSLWAVSCNRSGPDSLPAGSSSEEKGSSNQALGDQRGPSTPTSAQKSTSPRQTKAQPPEISSSEKLTEILGLANRPERRQALDELAEGLFQRDPKQAAEVTRRILQEKGESSGDAYDFVSAFMSRYAVSDPTAAAAWADFLPLTLKFSAYTPVAQNWAANDWEAATQWAQKIEDLSLRSSVLRRISEKLEGSGLTEAAGTWAQALSKTSDAAQHTEVISRLWAARDVDGAYQWSAQLPAPEDRSKALAALAGVLAEKDPLVASQWVEKFPDEEARRHAAGITITKWAQTDPEAATRWLTRLGDPALLESGVRGIANLWLQKDRPRAEQWIQSAPLSQPTKEYLLGVEPKKVTSP